MADTISYREIFDPEEKSRICEAILETLPAWFGIASANDMYRTKIANMQVFGAFYGTVPVGAIALRGHFETSAEVWWMGVAASFHRKGIGRRLMHMALDHARAQGYLMAVLNTLSPKSPDPGYAATRAFYRAEGFTPLVHFNEDNHSNPMMWMIKPLSPHLIA